MSSFHFLLSNEIQHPWWYHSHRGLSIRLVGKKDNLLRFALGRTATAGIMERKKLFFRRLSPGFFARQNLVDDGSGQLHRRRAFKQSGAAHLANGVVPVHRDVGKGEVVVDGLHLAQLSFRCDVSKKVLPVAVCLRGQIVQNLKGGQGSQKVRCHQIIEFGGICAAVLAVLRQ